MSIEVEVVTDVEIPDAATCFCPLRGGSVFMRACTGCDYNMGLFVFDENSEKFDARYRLLCASPIPRQITTIEG